MKENVFQSFLIKELKKKYKGAIVLKNDSSIIQGIPDLLVLYGKKWFALECKKNDKANIQPNQEYYINKMSNMSFASFINPSNKEEVLKDMDRFIWNDHYRISKNGDHAFLGASNYHWLNYDEERLKKAYLNNLAKVKGTELHAFAAKCISLKQKLPDLEETLCLYVNDALDFGMSPEIVLYYSENCFGTADAILFKDNVLRIHDLKTGVGKVSMNQLMIYSALFCLEYGFDPKHFDDIILRIYQNDSYEEYKPDYKDIYLIMDKIIKYDKIIQSIKEEV